MPTKTRWSADRPVKPDVDPMLGDLREALRKDNRSTFAKANVSGLSPSTIKNILEGRTRMPQGLTYQMAYRMLGYQLRPVRIQASRAEAVPEVRAKKQPPIKAQAAKRTALVRGKGRHRTGTS